MKTKLCSSCKEIKPISEFWHNRRAADGYHYWCKSCNRKATVERNHRIGRNQPFNENTTCSSYLGVCIAERMLSHVFKNVERMPYGNKGFDFICGRGYKIDVKSSSRQSNHNHKWHFNIKRNKIADYFLLIAFNNREDLDPEHVWLIPGYTLNDKISTSISDGTISKWEEYELHDKLDAVISCCDTLKGDEHDSSE